MEDRPLLLQLDAAGVTGVPTPLLPRWVDLAARGLMCLLFLLSGFGKLEAASAIQGYMAAHGVPGILIWPAAALEICGGALLLVGYRTRTVALVLSGWCLLTAFIFHTAFGDQDQFIHFFKNMTMAGGFLVLARSGAPGVSIDGLIAARGADAGQPATERGSI